MISVHSFESFWTMENGTFSALLLLSLATFATVWYALHQLYAPKHDPREPPLVTHSIPHIGHIIGIVQYGARYYEMTR